jgi:mannose-6-phosphate isomerase-like protein (cupin superfamily)
MVAVVQAPPAASARGVESSRDRANRASARIEQTDVSYTHPRSDCSLLIRNTVHVAEGVAVIIRMGEVVPFDFGGLAIRDYTAGQQISSSFAVISVPPGSVHPEAFSRRSDKYYFVVTGSVEFIDDGEAHALSAGDFCLVSQGQRFSYRNVSDTPATLCLVHTPGFDADAEILV